MVIQPSGTSLLFYSSTNIATISIEFLLALVKCCSNNSNMMVFWAVQWCFYALKVKTHYKVHGLIQSQTYWTRLLTILLYNPHNLTFNMHWSTRPMLYGTTINVSMRITTYYFLEAYLTIELVSLLNPFNCSASLDNNIS